MPEEQIKRKRGRPPKNQQTQAKMESSSASQDESLKSETSAYTYHSWCNTLTTTDHDWESIFDCGVYDYFTKEEIRAVFINPIVNHDIAIRLSEFVYGKNGIITNAVDYPINMMTLDRLITCNQTTNKAKKNKELMKSTLKLINDKKFIRDALHTDSLDGICFYYFDVRKKSHDRTKFMSDYDVENIVEINERGINASIVTLPWQYTKIIGKKNGRYVLAFDLRYFNDFTGEKLERKLKKYPQEIVDGYYNKNRTGDWMVLDNDKTICHKIKCKDSEPWGRSLIIAALEDVLYKDYFTDTKRNVLDNINNQIIYETFPEGKDKGICSLNKKQQEDQHNTVKKAVMSKNSRGGISFFSVAAGTKIDDIEVNTDIFDDDKESNLNDTIATDIGVNASLVGASVSSSYGISQSNLELVTSNMYTWITEIKDELVYVINKNIIQDEKNYVDVYYFPTSFANRKDFFEMMKTLYMNGSGSLRFLIASAGVDVDVYLSAMNEEIADGYDEKYLPHQTSYTYTGENNSEDNEGGRPETDNPTDSTLNSRDNNGNDIPDIG